jgi:acyl carrier protein
MERVEAKVLEVFKSVLSLADGSSTDVLVYNEYPAWDSVAHMAIVAGLEASFDCMLDMQDILDMSSFSKSVEIMRKYSDQG